MILCISIETRADRNISYRGCYASHEEVANGVHVDRKLPSQYREHVKGIFVKTSDDGECVEVESCYGSAKFPIDKQSRWESGLIGLDYACCEVSITFTPYIQEYWDVLLTTHGGATSMIARDEIKKGMNLAGLRPSLDGTPMPGMDLEVCYITHDRLGLYVGSDHHDFFYVSLEDGPKQMTDVTLTLESYSTLITEWDEIEDKPVQCIVDTKDFVDSLTDPEAAMRVADSVAEQHPEMLELIAKYMGFAANLGSADAIAWLRDYYEDDDSRYHAYD